MKTVVCLSVVCALAIDCYGAEHQLPDNPKAVVIQYDQPIYISGRKLPRSGPDLQILADGTIVVHDPFGRPQGLGGALPDRLVPGGIVPGGVVPDGGGAEPAGHVKKIESTKLSAKEMQALLAFIVDEQKFFEVKVDNSQLQRMLADANNTSIQVDIDGKKKQHHVYAIDQAARFATEENGLTQMRAIFARLKPLRAQAIQAAQAEKQ